MKEEWREIEYPYYISNLGNFRKEDNIVLGTIKENGYRRVSIFGKTNYVHHLVTNHFIGLIPGGHCINHKDGNKLNNAISNLEIISKRDDILHMYSTGLRKLKIDIPTAHEIRRRHFEDGKIMDHMAKEYDVDPGAIRNIINGRVVDQNSPGWVDYPPRSKIRKMEALLRELEWSCPTPGAASWADPHCCPDCGGHDPTWYPHERDETTPGHAADCRLMEMIG